MRLALISDIHANLPALRAVLADIDARPDITGTFHIGDLVGYAPWPNEVVAELRARGINCVNTKGHADTFGDHAKHFGHAFGGLAT
ncbi:MAG: metallophosphoesterase family protein, partial [Gemmatimonadetes bacterium]|nr:metallophosphoesterase family protein [Gemmatimonadota bacterium]